MEKNHGRYFAFLSLFIYQVSFANSPYLKVRVGRAIPGVAFSGLDLKGHLGGKNFEGKEKLSFGCFQKKAKPQLLASVSSLTGFLNWNEQKYRGNFEVFSQGQGQCDLVNKVNLEDYIATVLAKEMSTRWPIEALKAQAVVARSYALYKKRSRPKKNEGHFHIENTEQDQVSGSFGDETLKTILATRKTKGEILVTYQNLPVPTFYHSKCGGKTKKPENVWSSKVEGYRSVNCPFCRSVGLKPWVRRVAPKDFIKSYNTFSSGKDIRLEKNLFIKPSYRKDPVVEFFQKGSLKKIKKSWLRKHIGPRKLPSNHWRVTSQEAGKWRLEGNGLGHGVGMCQFGTKVLAERGWSYKEILAYYYPGHKIRKIYL